MVIPSLRRNVTNCWRYCTTTFFVKFLKLLLFSLVSEDATGSRKLAWIVEETDCFTLNGIFVLFSRHPIISLSVTTIIESAPGIALLVFIYYVQPAPLFLKLMANEKCTVTYCRWLVHKFKTHCWWIRKHCSALTILKTLEVTSNQFRTPTYICISFRLL